MLFEKCIIVVRITDKWNKATKDPRMEHPNKYENYFFWIIWKNTN